MRENLMNKSHKTTTQAYRDGWDRTFGKTQTPGAGVCAIGGDHETSSTGLPTEKAQEDMEGAG